MCLWVAVHCERRCGLKLSCVKGYVRAWTFCIVRFYTLRNLSDCTKITSFIFFFSPPTFTPPRSSSVVSLPFALLRSHPHRKHGEDRLPDLSTLESQGYSKLFIRQIFSQKRGCVRFWFSSCFMWSLLRDHMQVKNLLCCWFESAEVSGPDVVVLMIILLLVCLKSFIEIKHSWLYTCNLWHQRMFHDGVYLLTGCGALGWVGSNHCLMICFRSAHSSVV